MSLTASCKPQLRSAVLASALTSLTELPNPVRSTCKHLFHVTWPTLMLQIDAVGFGMDWPCTRPKRKRWQNQQNSRPKWHPEGTGHVLPHMYSDRHAESCALNLAALNKATCRQMFAIAEALSVAFLVSASILIPYNFHLSSGKSTCHICLVQEGSYNYGNLTTFTKCDSHTFQTCSGDAGSTSLRASLLSSRLSPNRASLLRTLMLYMRCCCSTLTCSDAAG